MLENVERLQLELLLLAAEKPDRRVHGPGRVGLDHEPKQLDGDVAVEGLQALGDARGLVAHLRLEELAYEWRRSVVQRAREKVEQGAEVVAGGDAHEFEQRW
jgi:hypothetical protein